MWKINQLLLITTDNPLLVKYLQFPTNRMINDRQTDVMLAMAA